MFEWKNSSMERWLWKECILQQIDNCEWCFELIDFESAAFLVWMVSQMCWSKSVIKVRSLTWKLNEWQLCFDKDLLHFDLFHPFWKTEWCAMIIRWHCCAAVLVTNCNHAPLLAILCLCVLNFGWQPNTCSQVEFCMWLHLRHSTHAFQQADVFSKVAESGVLSLDIDEQANKTKSPFSFFFPFSCDSFFNINESTENLMFDLFFLRNSCESSAHVCFFLQWNHLCKKHVWCCAFSMECFCCFVLLTPCLFAVSWHWWPVLSSLQWKWKRKTKEKQQLTSKLLMFEHFGQPHYVVINQMMTE